MNIHLSVIIITKNAAQTLRRTLQSVKGLADEIIIVDDYSTDSTLEIAIEFESKIYFHHEKDLGKRKLFALQKSKGTWILVLDSDEILSNELKQEIYSITHHTQKSRVSNGYVIPFQNHFLGKKISHGGENYSMMRFFKKDTVIIQPALVHEHFTLTSGKTGHLNGQIYHYSYRSLRQMFAKFTKYAWREARQKFLKGEKAGIKHLVMYPIHMFWARFIEDHGYKDGFFRIPLDVGFAYMEFMTYLFLFFQVIFSKSLFFAK